MVGKLEQEIEKTREAFEDMNKRAGKYYMIGHTESTLNQH